MEFEKADYNTIILNKHISILTVIIMAMAMVMAVLMAAVIVITKIIRIRVLFRV